jgi:hypothetical protein
MVSKGARPCLGFPRHPTQRPAEHDGHERYDVRRVRRAAGNVGLTDHRQYVAAIIDGGDGHDAIIKGMPLAGSRSGPICVGSVISNIAATRHSAVSRFRVALLIARLRAESLIPNVDYRIQFGNRKWDS